MKMTMISHPRYSRLQICAMRPALHTCLLLAALCLLAPPARAATNDVTTALQRGLVEEEANQNLGAAIQAYQTVANQFDKDRKLAATAIFRLGECYRKQGNTNDAAIQYERILREFSDQPTLVTLSRQSLAGMGSALPAPGQAATRQYKYTVVQGDVFSKIAKAYGLPSEALMDANPGINSARLRVGQVLQIPANPDLSTAVSAAPAQPTPTTSTEAEEVKRIQALIKDSPDLINAPDQKGVTLLESAAAKGKLAV